MNNTEMSLKTVGHNLNNANLEVERLTAERDALKANLPDATPVVGGEGVAIVLRSCRVTGPNGDAIDAPEKSIVCVDHNKVLQLKGLNPNAPGVFCIKTEEMIELLENGWAKATNA